MAEQIMTYIAQYGYWGLYVFLAVSMLGLPVPDETIMTFAGYGSASGKFSFFAAWLCCLAGTMTGMTVSYSIARKWGYPFLHKYGKWLHISPARLAKAERWMQKYGIWTVSFGYFIPGVRHFTCYLSGASRVPYAKYALFAGSGALAWSGTFLFLGHTVGGNWRKLPDSAEKLVLAAIVCAAVIAGAAVYAIRRRKRTRR